MPNNWLFSGSSTFPEGPSYLWLSVTISRAWYCAKSLANEWPVVLCWGQFWPLSWRHFWFIRGGSIAGIWQRLKTMMSLSIPLGTGQSRQQRISQLPNVISAGPEWTWIRLICSCVEQLACSLSCTCALSFTHMWLTSHSEFWSKAEWGLVSPKQADLAQFTWLPWA